MRIAQLVVAPVAAVQPRRGRRSSPVSERGGRGFGSSATLRHGAADSRVGDPPLARADPAAPAREARRRGLAPPGRRRPERARASCVRSGASCGRRRGSSRRGSRYRSRGRSRWSTRSLRSSGRSRKHVVHVIFAADVSGSLEDVDVPGRRGPWPSRVPRSRARLDRPPPADPAVPAALAARRPRRLPRGDVGAVARVLARFCHDRAPLVPFLVRLTAGGGPGCPSGIPLQRRPPRFRARSAATRNASASSSSESGSRARVAVRRVRERLSEQPVGQPRVPRKQRAVEVRPDRPAEPAAFEPRRAVVAESEDDAPERRCARVEQRPPRVVLEAGELRASHRGRARTRAGRRRSCASAPATVSCGNRPTPGMNEPSRPR